MWAPGGVRTVSRFALLALLVAPAACGAEAPAVGRLDVYAASSLTEAFTELERLFESAHGGVDVRVTFAGSQALRLQIEQGATADVFASANRDHVQALAAVGLVERGRVFARNDLVIVVPPDNPSAIASFEDLRRAQRLVLGTESVPVGRYAREAIRRGDALHGEGFGADVLDGLASEEANVRLARAKVELGEADAAIVYRTDAGSSDRVRVVPVPRELNVVADYTIGVVASSDAPELARRWIDLLLSAEGRAVLERHGFLRP